MESVEPAGTGNELRPFRLERLPDCMVGQLRMMMHLGVSDALIEQPGVFVMSDGQRRRNRALCHDRDEMRAKRRLGMNV